MLTESEVVKAVCGFLENNGFQVRQALCETERGVDILAISLNGQRQVSIEAKGETSSKPSTNRYGKAFNGGQVLDHVSKALYCAARDCSSSLAGIALPKAARKVRKRILPALRTLQIEVFWVLPDSKVETKHIWNFWDCANSHAASQSVGPGDGKSARRN